MEVKRIPIDLIDGFPLQVRKKFDADKISELAESIKEVDVISPPVVQKKGDRYGLIAGERRVSGAKEAGLTDILVVVREGLTDFQALLISGSENIQRVDLTSVERETLIYQLWEIGQRDNSVVSKADLARKIGLSPPYLREIIDAHEFRTLAAIDSSVSTRTIHATIGLPYDERIKLLARHKEGEIRSSEIREFVSVIKTASEPVKRVLLEIGSRITVDEAISIDTNLETITEKKRALDILKEDKDSRLDVILEIVREGPRPTIMLDEIHTGYMWKCPICGENHHLIHVAGDKKNKHRFEKVV